MPVSRTLQKKRYLQFTKIKVSNAIINIPKAIRSLKSYFIRTTSHLCMMEGQRPCSDTIAPCHNNSISPFNVQLFSLAAGYHGPAAFLMVPSLFIRDSGFPGNRSFSLLLFPSALVIADRLGHEKTETTLNIYSHLFPHNCDEVDEKSQKCF